jgi:crossover junction endodeoxyribonuclease RuvC
MSTDVSRRILGIDPGSRITGVGVIEVCGQKSRYLHHASIRTEGQAFPVRLDTIFSGISQIITEFQPTEMAIEQVFMHRNADSALKLGQARGAAIVAGTQAGLVIHEYSAKQIKQAIVGKGAAAKQQVQHMVKVLLQLAEIPQEDAADALAAALCHAHSSHNLIANPALQGLKMRGGRLR